MPFARVPIDVGATSTASTIRYRSLLLLQGPGAGPRRDRGKTEQDSGQDGVEPDEREMRRILTLDGRRVVHHRR